jgi:NADP-dependent 3-hydroxy acid dehydrogenase YdfG
MTDPTHPDLSGTTAIVTGASRGIGEATACHLAALGAHVFLAARSADAIKRIAGEIAEAGGTAMAVPTDMADHHAVAALVRAATEATGRLDLLVNNAGLIDPIARIADSDPDAWGDVIDVNVKGVYYGLRHALPVMQVQGSGTIVNISSGAANSALEGWSHYCASKAAVLRLTGVAHKEVSSFGIRVGA